MMDQYRANTGAVVAVNGKKATIDGDIKLLINESIYIPKTQPGKPVENSV